MARCGTSWRSTGSSSVTRNATRMSGRRSTPISRLPTIRSRAYMLTVPPRATANASPRRFRLLPRRPDRRRLRNKSTVTAALADRLLKPFQITRLRVARSLLAHQKPDEARYHPRNLGMGQSVMSNDRPLRAGGYGDEHFEVTEGSGGLSGAVVDVARILAAMNARPYTPLGRLAVESLLQEAVGSGKGHGFDDLNGVAGSRSGAEGGLFQTSQAGVWFQENGLSSVIVWNGQHTGNDTRYDGGSEDFGWYPRFDNVLNAAAGVSWGTTDLFPDYGWTRCPRPRRGRAGVSGARACSSPQPARASARRVVAMTAAAAATTASCSIRPSPMVRMAGALQEMRRADYGGFGPGVCAAGGGRETASRQPRLPAGRELAVRALRRGARQSRSTGATAGSARLVLGGLARARAIARRAARATGSTASTTPSRCGVSGRRPFAAVGSAAARAFRPSTFLARSRATGPVNADHDARNRTLRPRAQLSTVSAAGS